MKLLDLTGQKFGRLTVLKISRRDKHNTYWLCKCDCGNLKEAKSRDLRNSITQSCGCLHKEAITKHKKCDTRLYSIWTNMKTRCNNKNAECYKDYGARGIRVCDEWLNDFQVFYDWAIDNDYQENLTIDRIDFNSNYEPSNCRWVDRKTQNRNTRHNRNITINNETHCLKEWCEILDLKPGTVYARLKHGWDLERALNYGKVSD